MAGCNLQRWKMGQAYCITDGRQQKQSGMLGLVSARALCRLFQVHTHVLFKTSAIKNWPSLLAESVVRPRD